MAHMPANLQWEFRRPGILPNLRGRYNATGSWPSATTRDYHASVYQVTPARSRRRRTYGFPSFMLGCNASTWHHLNNDHTGNPYGYFMLVNGPPQPEVVYSEKVPGSTLCPNTTYEFTAWIMNVLILSDSTANWVLPNLTLSIETASGKVLKAVSTGDIPETTSPVWNQYFDYFVSPADGSDVYVKIYDNQLAKGLGQRQ